MQKTAFKVFLCSFSVSMLAMSVASKAFLQAKTAAAPLTISNKNISLFIKDITPKKYPTKKIDLAVLAEPQPISEPEHEYPLSDDGIIVADELEYGDIPFTDDATLSADGEEDQKIFLADVVYSQEQPLEKLTVDADVVYAPEVNEVKVADASEATEESLTEKLAIYDGSSPEKQLESPKKQTEPSEKAPSAIKVADKVDSKPDSPLPLLYEKKPSHPINVDVGEAENLNHVAMKIDNVPIESLTNSEEIATENAPEQKKWQQMRDNPWLVARSNGQSRNKLANSKDNVSDDEIKEALNVHKPKKGVEVATETVKNLIIPLPEKLADNENLMPKLAYPEGSSDDKKERAMNALSMRLEKAKEKKSLLTEIDDGPEMSMIPDEEDAKDSVDDDEKEDKKGLLSSLGSLLTNKTKELTKKLSDTTDKLKLKKQARLNLKRAAEANRNIPIMPREIRMSFQANKAEISGQTLRWVQAFATKAAQDSNTYLEVRIDASRPTVLQQRRLNLLYNILTNKGVEYSKINVVYTTREPNSFILKMVNLDNDNEGYLDKMNKAGKNYLQW